MMHGYLIAKAGEPSSLGLTVSIGLLGLGLLPYNMLGRLYGRSAGCAVWPCWRYQRCACCPGLLGAINALPGRVPVHGAIDGHDNAL